MKEPPQVANVLPVQQVSCVYFVDGSPPLLTVTFQPAGSEVESLAPDAVANATAASPQNATMTNPPLA